jgi:hypothetical protein
MSNVKAWPLATGRPVKQPRQIVRPCDYSLRLAVNALEAQLGTIEAYNRLVKAAQLLREQIELGEAKPQNPIFAVSIDGAPRK